MDEADVMENDDFSAEKTAAFRATTGSEVELSEQAGLPGRKKADVLADESALEDLGEAEQAIDSEEQNQKMSVSSVSADAHSDAARDVDAVISADEEQNEEAAKQADWVRDVDEVISAAEEEMEAKREKKSAKGAKTSANSQLLSSEETSMIQGDLARESLATESQDGFLLDSAIASLKHMSNKGEEMQDIVARLSKLRASHARYGSDASSPVEENSKSVGMSANGPNLMQEMLEGTPAASQTSKGAFNATTDVF
eukprot:TRINITY_DN27369_c0_g1_i2.p1 TRINITY_DN27369_c0_g1~~TRINITY_DN27369_c0_g1_i2.p1  ORF type:complete len:255 (+),score=92.45 TRINITY_DN27369_c0_g1_i2:383-1147(+)